MNNIKKSYEMNILSINNAISIYQYLQSQAKNLDATILLRSQFVLIVSAFDTYIHSMVISRIIDKYFSSEQPLDIQLDIPLKLAYEMKALSEDRQKEKLYSFLVKKLGKDSFQSPESIEYAFSIIGINKIWTKLSENMGRQPDDIKNMLSIIVNRRNKIAHESDWNITTGTYEDIELADVLECKNFIFKAKSRRFQNKISEGLWEYTKKVEFYEKSKHIFNISSCCIIADSLRW